MRLMREVGMDRMVGWQSGQQGQAVALSERDGGAGQEEEGNLRVKYSQIDAFYHRQNKTINPSNLCAATLLNQLPTIISIIIRIGRVQIKEHHLSPGYTNNFSIYKELTKGLCFI